MLNSATPEGARLITRVVLTLMLLVLAAAPVAEASDVASHTVIVPVIGRTPGAFGSEWRTDVYITNAEPSGEAVTAAVIFSRAQVADQIFNVVLPPRATVVIRDIVREKFGHAVAAGLLRITTPRSSAQLAARARIYNVGSGSGEFGQTVPALPLQKLSRVALLPGLDGTAGIRTNVGVANPHSVEVPIFVSFFDAEGELRGGFATVVAPGSVSQFVDVFAGTTYGEEGASIQITSERGVYAYASVVRRDSGDADFVAPVATQLDHSHDVIEPACATPAALRFAPRPAEGWIVTFRANVDAATEAARLATTYGFVVKNQYLFGFFALLSPQQIAALRCEASVSEVNQNGSVAVP